MPEFDACELVSCSFHKRFSLSIMIILYYGIDLCQAWMLLDNLFLNSNRSLLTDSDPTLFGLSDTLKFVSNMILCMLYPTVPIVSRCHFSCDFSR